MWLPFYVFLLYVYNAEVLDLTEWTRLMRRWRHLRKMRSAFSLEAAGKLDLDDNVLTIQLMRSFDLSSSV
jgi:hypothetical protein